MDFNEDAPQIKNLNQMRNFENINNFKTHSLLTKPQQKGNNDPPKQLSSFMPKASLSESQKNLQSFNPFQHTQWIKAPEKESTDEPVEKEPEDSDNEFEYVVEEFSISLTDTEGNAPMHKPEEDRITADIATSRNKTPVPNETNFHNVNSQITHLDGELKKKLLIERLLHEGKDNTYTNTKRKSRDTSRNRMQGSHNTYNAVLQQKVSSPHICINFKFYGFSN